MNANNNLELLRIRKFYNYFQFLNIITATAKVSQGDMLVSASDDVSDQKELGTSGVVGIFFTTTIRFSTILPFDFDPNYKFGIRFAFSTTRSATPTTFTHTESVSTAALVAGSSTALNLITLASTTQITESNDTLTDNLLYWSKRLSAKYTNSRANIETGALLVCQMDVDAATNLSGIYLWGVELDYVPWLCNGNGRELDCPLGITANLAL